MPLPYDAGSWRILAVNQCKETDSSFHGGSPVYQMWLINDITKHQVSHRCLRAFSSEKCSQIWQKMTVPGLSRLLKVQNSVMRRAISTWLWSEMLWALHVIARKPIQARLSLWVVFNSSPGSTVEWCVHHVGEQSPRSPILLDAETSSIKASCCGSKGPAVRAVFMTSTLRK